MTVPASRLRHLQARAGEMSRHGPTPPEILAWLKLVNWYLGSVRGRHGNSAVGRRLQFLVGRSTPRSSSLWAQCDPLLCSEIFSEFQRAAKLAHRIVDAPVARPRRHLISSVRSQFTHVPPQGPTVLPWRQAFIPARRSRRDLIYELWPFWPEANSWRCRKARPDRARHREALAEAAVERPARRSRRRVAPLAVASSMSTRQSGS
jgi:hypothetical protein